jgi:hypothetical protein
MHIRKTTLSIVSTMLLTTLPVAASAEFNPTDDGTYQGGQFNATQTVWREALDRAIDRVINPDDYICNSPTDFDLWVNAQFFAIDPILADVLFGLSILSWAGDSKLIMDQNDRYEYIGVNGEHTSRQNRTFKDNRRFWDIDSSDILLQGMHGADIADDSIMYPFINWAFGAPPFVTEIIVENAQNVIAGGPVDLSFFVPGLIFESEGIPGGYNNPLLTLNAFAFTSGDTPLDLGFGEIQDKIVMGEGLLDGLLDIGIGGKEGPDNVLAHEFAHHVQYEIGAFLEGPPTPEGTRRTELMADSFAAYYGAHALGNTFQAKRFADVMTASYEIGDCAFSSTNHHGTQLQREHAAAWGGWVADSQQKMGHKNGAVDMMDMFDAILPLLVAPDAP